MAPSLAEEMPLIDHYLEAEFKFGTDMNMGIGLNRAWGYISSVDEGTQASQQGVEKGSYIVRLNGEKYTEEAMNEFVSRKENFTVQLRRTTNPDDMMKDVFYHQYKDYMMLWTWWSAWIFTICGGVIILCVIIDEGNKCPKHGLLLCGVACIVSGVLLWILEAFARRDLREPVSSLALFCVGACIGVSMFLSMSTLSGFKSCGATDYSGLPLVQVAVIFAISGDLGALIFMWAFFGKRAQMGMAFYMPG